MFYISQAGHYCKLMYLLKSVHYAICFLDTLDQESCNVNLFPIVWKHFQLCTLGFALSLSAIAASVRCLFDVPLSAHIAYLQIQHLVLDSRLLHLQLLSAVFALGRAWLRVMICLVASCSIPAVQLQIQMHKHKYKYNAQCLIAISSICTWLICKESLQEKFYHRTAHSA